MVGFSSVCLYGRSTAAAAAVGGFAAERFAGRRRRSTAAGAVQQSPALSRPRSESDISTIVCLFLSVIEIWRMLVLTPGSFQVSKALFTITTGLWLRLRPPRDAMRHRAISCSQYCDCDCDATVTATGNKHVHFSARLHEVAANRSAGIGVGVVDQLCRHCLLLFYDTIRYDTIRDAILTCARNPT